MTMSITKAGKGGRVVMIFVKIDYGLATYIPLTLSLATVVYQCHKILLSAVVFCSSIYLDIFLIYG
jgi:hypothetical protein